MDLAAERLPPDGLIATTDADSDARARLARARNSTRSPRARDAIGGRIEVGAHDLPPAALARREADAARRRAALRGRRRARAPPVLAAPRSRSPPRRTRRWDGSSRAPALEDEGFERALHRHGVPIERLAAVQRDDLRPAARARAAAGLAVDLRRNAWLAERSYARGDFTLDAPARRQGAARSA